MTQSIVHTADARVLALYLRLFLKTVVVLLLTHLVVVGFTSSLISGQILDVLSKCRFKYFGRARLFTF